MAIHPENILVGSREGGVMLCGLIGQDPKYSTSTIIIKSEAGGGEKFVKRWWSKKTKTRWFRYTSSGADLG